MKLHLFYSLNKSKSLIIANLRISPSPELISIKSNVFKKVLSRYADIGEQLDQLYHDMTAGKLDATGEWHKAIKAVKDAHSK